MSHTEHFLLKTKTADYQASDQGISLRQILRVYAAFLHLLLLTLILLREHHTYINDRNVIPVLSLYIAQSWSRLIQLFSMKNAASSSTRLSIITLIIFLSFTKNALPLQCCLYVPAKLRTFWPPSAKFFWTCARHRYSYQQSGKGSRVSIGLNPRNIAPRRKMPASPNLTPS